MQYKVGVMQGRLSPAPDERLQFFPYDWQREFSIARQLGFDSIEWLFDWSHFEKNPVWDESTWQIALKAAHECGISISSICADYFMKYKLLGSDAHKSLLVLRRLLKAAATTDQKLILIPFLENNAIRNENEKKEIVAHLDTLLDEAQALGVHLAFETELSAPELQEFLMQFRLPQIVGVYYDIGNCTSYGFNCPQDIHRLGNLTNGIHVKDRKRGSSTSVLLGTGHADFEGCLSALHNINYRGTYVLQAWRGEHYLEDTKYQLSFLRKKLDSLSTTENT